MLDGLMQGMAKNSEGIIDRSEAPAPLVGSFERVDTNSDGGIDRQEADIIVQHINH